MNLQRLQAAKNTVAIYQSVGNFGYAGCGVDGVTAGNSQRSRPPRRTSSVSVDKSFFALRNWPGTVCFSRAIISCIAFMAPRPCCMGFVSGSAKIAALELKAPFAGNLWRLTAPRRKWYPRLGAGPVYR